MSFHKTLGYNVIRVLLVALGGALGASTRYLLGMWIQTRVGPDFPWGTFVINVTGSFLIGIVLGLVNAGTLSAEARLFLAVGVLGGYTTFSSFSYETLELLGDGNIQAFLFNAIGQLVAGLLAVYLGIVLSRSLGGVR
ncbi:MAG: fluoride efflux transporter CrcB [Ktedonobacterales bacterium]